MTSAPAPAGLVELPRRRTRAVWARVDDGFWVANAEGAFLGSVDAVAAGFVARDAQGTPIGLFTTLMSAQLSLDTVETPRNIRRRERRLRSMATTATVMGAATLSLALTAGVLAPHL